MILPMELISKNVTSNVQWNVILYKNISFCHVKIALQALVCSFERKSQLLLNSSLNIRA